MGKCKRSFNVQFHLDISKLIAFIMYISLIWIYFLVLIRNCSTLTLPKIFTDNMVIQAAPKEGIVWGFLDRNFPVTFEIDCGDGESNPETQIYNPEEVLTYL